MKAAVPHFRSMLRSFTSNGDGIQPPTLHDRRFRNYCLSSLSKLVGVRIQVSTLAGVASSSRTTDPGSTLMVSHSSCIQVDFDVEVENILVRPILFDAIRS